MTRFLAAALLVLSTVSAWAETLYVHSAGDGYLNLRTGPGGSYAIIGEMYHGDPVEVVRWGDGWHEVRHAGSGWTGWASSAFLQGDPNLTYMIVNSPGDGYLNLRTGPGGSHQVIGRMDHRSPVWTLGRRSGPWLLVEHADTGWQGWAHSNWLTAPR